MKTKLKIGSKTCPMHIEDETGALVTIHTHQLSPVQMKILKDHLRLVAAAFTDIARYADKR